MLSRDANPDYPQIIEDLTSQLYSYCLKTGDYLTHSTNSIPKNRCPAPVKFN